MQRHETLELCIHGLDCMICAGHLEQIVKDTPGINKVTIPHKQTKMLIELNPEKTSVDVIHKIIEDAGFTICTDKSHNEAVTVSTVQLDESRTGQVTLQITNMDCPTEETLIRNKLDKYPGILGLEFNLLQRTLTIVHNLSTVEPVINVLKSIGMQVDIPADDDQPPQHESVNWWLIAVSGVSAVLAELVELFQLGYGWLTFALALTAILTGGLRTYQKGWIAVRNRNLNINALMSIAVTGALLIGQWPEAAMVMFLFTIAELIERKSLDKARNAIRGLLEMAPENATIQADDGTWQEVAAARVEIGSIVRVRPGERVALDGVVIDGSSTVDQSPITGESLPIDVQANDRVFAGTINQNGSFTYKTTSIATKSTLSRIIHAVEEAQSSKASTQRFVDRFSKIYTPAVFVIAIAVAIIPPLLMGGTWQQWLYNSLVLMVIACPCALVISTPITIVSGIAAAARHGILIKGGAYLEEGRKLTWLALDKTGTITNGKPSQTDFAPVSSIDPLEARTIAASLAIRSDHPVSFAIAESAKADSIQLRDVSEFTALNGRGVFGKIDGTTYYLGNSKLQKEMKVPVNDISVLISNLELQGKSVVVLSDENKALAYFAVADTVKASSRQAIDSLHKIGIRTIMLSGDNSYTASAIARKVGIDEVRAELLPEDKLKVIEKYIGDSGAVGMVGDGINDAPALARADIGFAMAAAGTDTAIETADVAIMDDDLRKIPKFVQLSHATSRILVQNISIALGIKTIFLALTLMGHATMWMAVFADMGASLIVVGNGLRLLRE